MITTSDITLITIAGYLLWPIGLLILLILIQIIMLLYGVSDCLTIIRYELLPALKDVRLTVSHLETLGDQMVTGAQLVEQTVRRSQWGIQALVTGLKKSFHKR